MSKRSLVSQLKQSWFWRRKSHSKGFTLLELLVVTLIAGGIISGLMFMVIQLMTADQRESSLSETQREMQMALDYISNELREAVYIYSADCLSGQGVPGDVNYCPGLVNGYLPTSVTTNSVPIIAFWKQQPIPDAVRARCTATNSTVPSSLCLAANSYSLVVYSLSRDNPSSVWRGRSRITRYALSQFDAAGNENSGYVDPGAYKNFDTWPFGMSDTNGFMNLQAARPTGNPVVLTDFVDDGRGATATNVAGFANCPDNPTTPNPDYMMTPSTTMLSSLGFANVRSFYVCVSTGSTTGENRDVIVYLRGNANGRPGISTDNAFLPTLETRVLSRGVLGKNPGS